MYTDHVPEVYKVDTSVLRTIISVPSFDQTLGLNVVATTRHSRTNDLTMSKALQLLWIKTQRVKSRNNSCIE